MLITLATGFPAEETLKVLVDQAALRIKDIQVAGYRVNTNSQRYALFSKSRVCVCCGRVGTEMRLEREPSIPGQLENRAHFNLYSEDGVLFTKDHIQPKSKGGRNFASNYQTLCSLCNTRKGAALVRVIPVQEVSPHPTADHLEVLRLGEHSVVVRKGQFLLGSLVAFLPAGVFLPEGLVATLGAQMEPPYQVKTTRIRGVLSEGLVYPALPEWEKGQNVTLLLGVRGKR